VDRTFIAAQDMDTHQYRFVIGGSIAGECDKAATAGGSVLGVLQNDPRKGEEAQVRVFGFSKVIANSLTTGSTVAAQFQYVKSGSDGMAWGFNTPVASALAVGMAMEALTTGSGVAIEIFVAPTFGFRA
jgi:hypothetical protein